jgi:hypothetical protein
MRWIRRYALIEYLSLDVLHHLTSRPLKCLENALYEWKLSEIEADQKAKGHGHRSSQNELDKRIQTDAPERKS